jgi:ABC-type branched-subunit amino acid transport system permease subunit
LRDYEQVVLGLTMMLIMIFLPAGILPALAARFGQKSGMRPEKRSA